MPTAIHDTDQQKAHDIMAPIGQMLFEQIAKAVADERERCAKIAEAIDSGRGNEKQIAQAIRAGACG